LPIRRSKDAQSHNYTIMDLKLILLIGIFCANLAIMPTVSAQLDIGNPATNKKLEVTIGENGEIHVMHEIKKSDSPKSVRLIEGTTSNIQVTDTDGNEMQHGISAGFGNTIITLFPTSKDIIIEYDLDDVMFTQKGITTTWYFLHLETTTFIFPESVELVFVNDRPVYLKNTNKIN